MATFNTAACPADDQDMASLKLYAWNAAVSGALLPVLHVCEVAVRNAVSEALEAVYGANWPWSPVFEGSLPRPRIGYNPRNDLTSARQGVRTVGKVIPELKFVFWQKMFTVRNDTRLWDPHLRRVFPNLDPSVSVATHRQLIYGQLEDIRKLRNRIAHHEPIFNRNLLQDYSTIMSLVHHRCNLTAMWVSQSQTALAVIKAKP
ncbi:hypothetical protein [Burkholderia sp. Bp8963]|uniref:hypothetical protein n=1 Tax=Burkholderia sp. Bp8963 TaxID=2184547 RepID=UPI00163AB023|nr:hypothetical protein [Burkholderia sp. Bp8963]